MTRRLLIIIPVVATLVATWACAATEGSSATNPRSVAEESYSDARAALVDLGRHLFYDRQLSANGTRSCATCHQQDRGFSDGQPTPMGLNGERLQRNSPGLFNTGALAALTWADPSLRSLEQQIMRPLFAEHPPEMGLAGHEAEVLARLRNDAAYPARFAAAFPNADDPIDWNYVVAALAAFTDALVARDTPYDRFLYAGDSMALSPAAQRGMRLFFSKGLACGHCHVDLMPPGQNDSPRWADLDYLATGAGQSRDRGLAEYTGLPDDIYRFRVPPLRNVAMTAPYMHDGSLPTLEAVVRFYESAGREGAGDEPARMAARHPLVAGFTLSTPDRRDLVAFLEALTDTAALHDPRYSDPFAAQSMRPSLSFIQLARR